MYVTAINKSVSEFITNQSNDLQKSLEAVTKVKGFDPTLILVFMFIAIIVCGIVTLKVTSKIPI